MNDDMKKIFGKEFSYLKKLSVMERLTILWFLLSLVLTAWLADVSLVGTMVSALSMGASVLRLKHLPEFDDD